MATLEQSHSLTCRKVKLRGTIIGWLWSRRMWGMYCDAERDQVQYQPHCNNYVFMCVLCLVYIYIVKLCTLLSSLYQLDTKYLISHKLCSTCPATWQWMPVLSLSVQWMDLQSQPLRESIGSIQDGLHPCQVMYQPIVHTCMNLQQQVLINIYLAFSLLQFW